MLTEFVERDLETAGVIIHEPEESQRNFNIWRSKISQCNIEIMKHGASCSTIEQVQDVIRGGFMTCHQFFNSSMFKNFDISVTKKIKVSLIKLLTNQLINFSYQIHRKLHSQYTCQLLILFYVMYQLTPEEPF
jgi:hypothetical protein